MAETEIEELLDFDGSDYEFGSDEGPGEEENVEYRAAEEGNAVAAEQGEEQARARGQREISGSGEPEKAPDRRAVERSGGRVPEPRNPRRSSAKNDLEDGEFDTAMVKSKKQTEHGAVKDAKTSRKHHSNESTRDISDREADSRQDRKRRRDHDYERYQYSSSSRKQHERHTGRYDRPHGSDRRYDRFGDIPDSRTRGPPPFYRPNFSPGIMGPGRPDINHIRACTAGLEIFSPAQLQELLNQEHMLRSQQMLQFARLGIRPPPGQPMYPLMGPNMFRPPLQPMGPDRMSFLGGGHPGIQSFPPAAGRGPSGGGGGGFARPPGSDGRRPGAGAASGQLENGKRPAAAGSSPSGKQRERSLPRRSDKDAEVKSRSRRTRSSTAADATGSDQDKRSSVRSSSRAAATDPAGSLIQLGGPVQKSRVLTVSGLLENTPMSAVADAFEKQGKILDFRKNQTGDVFAITFSSVQEAVSAKRHLHRSMLAGRQITVEYAVA